MSFPWVSRRSFDMVVEERDRLLGEVSRLSDECRQLTNAVLTNARLVPAFETKGNRAKPIHIPARKSVEMRGRELAARERGE